MRRAVCALLVVAPAALAGCTAGPGEPEAQTAAPPTTSASGFASPELAGLCEKAAVEIPAEEPGAPTAEAAVEEFVRTDSILAATTIDDTEIRFDGEAVGEVRVSEAPAGGYYVSSAEWCYPR